MARTRRPTGKLNAELEDLPAPARWREWMGRVEAAIFASAEPVLRENLARVVGKACNLELVIDDIREELRGRPYEILSVAGGWMFRTKLGFGDAIRTALGATQKTELSRANAHIHVFSADHPGGAVAVSGQRGFARCDRGAARRGLDRRRGRAARPPALLMPTSPRWSSLRTSGSRACATCPTSRSSRTPDSSAGRATRFSAATRWRPS